VRGNWKLMLVVAVLLCVGCGNDEEPEGLPEADPWPNVECPPGSGVTAGERLEEIIALAVPPDPGTPTGDASKKAMECRDAHVVGLPMHVDKVFTAWNAARAGDWVACVSELTHGNDGGGAADD